MTEIYDAIRDNFKNLESGGEKIFDPEDVEANVNVLDDTQVVPITVHDADKAVAADVVDLEAEPMELDEKDCET